MQTWKQGELLSESSGKTGLAKEVRLYWWGRQGQPVTKIPSFSCLVSSLTPVAHFVFVVAIHEPQALFSFFSPLFIWTAQGVRCVWITLYGSPWMSGMFPEDKWAHLSGQAHTTDSLSIIGIMKIQEKTALDKESESDFFLASWIRLMALSSALDNTYSSSCNGSFII